MNFFDHKHLGNHLLQLCPKVVKHPAYTYEIPLKTKMYLSRFKINCMFYSRDSRNKPDLLISGHNINFFEQSIACNGMLICNKLSYEIKSVTCIMNSRRWLWTFTWKEILFCGRIYDYWSLIYKNCVNDVFLCCNYLFFIRLSYLISIPHCFY